MNMGQFSKIRLIEGHAGEDNRGRSTKLYSKELFKTEGIEFTPIEILSIHSKKNVLRGLHYQKRYGQSRAISCLGGKLFVVAVDLDSDSDFFGKWCSVILDNPLKTLYISSDCAVGTFAVEDTDFIYMCGENPFMPEYESGIIWNDKDINIEWQGSDETRIISKKDKAWHAFAEFKKNMVKYDER